MAHIIAIVVLAPLMETVSLQVFLHRGEVHIIPKPRSPAEIGLHPVDTPTIQEAVKLVRSEGVETRASSKVQECIQTRISRYTVSMAIADTA